MAVLLIPTALVFPVNAADTNIDLFPRIEDLYITIVYPEATAMSYARAGYLDTMTGMISPDNVEELAAGAVGQVLRPNAAGTNTQWTAVGAATNWDCVNDELFDGDTTHVYSTVDAKVDTYNLPNPGLSGTIKSVTVLAYGKYLNTTANDLSAERDGIQFVLKQGSIYNYSTTKTMLLTYPLVGNPAIHQWKTDPSDGLDWTWTDIDNLEVGVKHIARGVGADKVFVTMLWVEIAYLPVGVYPWSVSMNPGFHMCYVGINCRSYPPDLTPETPVPGAPYGARGPSFSLWPLNESDFRMALNFLIGCQKSTWIATLYRFINVRLDTCIPPANVFYYNTAIPPVDYNPTEAMNLLTGIGFSNATGKWIHATRGEMRPLYMLSPVTAPPTVALAGYVVQAWNNFFGNQETTGVFGGNYFQNFPIDPNLESELAWINRDFDFYLLCWGLGRDPDSLYFFFHPDLDYYDGYNSPGLTTPNREFEDMLYALEYWVFPDDTVAEVATDPLHPAYVGMVINNVTEMKILVDEIQWWLYYLVPYIPMYSRNYIQAYRYGLKNWIESTGYGSNNGWTTGFIYWTDLTKTSYNFHDGGNVYDLHPAQYKWVYEAEIIGRVLDGLMAIDPYTHADKMWMAKSYEYGVFTGTTPGGYDCDGSKVRFNLRSGMLWHDGQTANAYDVKFCWDALVEHKPRQGSTIWLTMVEAVVVDSLTIDAYINATGIWVVYDYAGTAFMLPPQIYGAFTGNTAGFKAFRPWEVAYPGAQNWTGNPYPWLTSLIGTGPYVFKEWDVVAGKAHLVAFRGESGYFAKNMLREDINLDGVIDVFDAVILADSAGATPGHPRWQYGRADITADYIVDVFDAVRLAGKAGAITLPS